jgi:Holliday junction resolvasome RuvABC endonuclease subunit
MIVIGIDPNTDFIAYCIMTDEMKIVDKGKCMVEFLTQFLNEKTVQFQDVSVAVEDFVFYGKILNTYHIETIKLIGRLQQYCDMNGLTFMAFGKPEINKSISRDGHAKKATMQGFVKWYLQLKEPIRPQHVNDAVCVAIVGMNKMKQEAIKKKVVK